MAQLDAWLKLLKDKQGSDLHLSPGNPALVRVSGELTPLDQIPLSAETIQTALNEMLTPQQREAFERTHDCDLAYQVDELKSRYRGNIFLGRHGISAVFRIIPTEIKTIQQLGLPESLLKFTELPKGLVLVTGGTGSGKSTTLAAMVDHINRTQHGHILTIEDPIEFVHQSQKSLVNQREVGRHTDSFASALKAALREDPDVILVGEMRDLETIELAITAAETGHLVFGTLHTNSAPKTIDRIINVFPTNQQAQIRTMLSESLEAVICQTLLRTTDYKRVAAIEVLVGTPAVSNLIREGKTFQIPGAIQTGKKDGMQSMDQAVQALLDAKRISMDEARPYLPKNSEMSATRPGQNGSTRPPLSVAA
jgi:twitching motility protein PilT